MLAFCHVLADTGQVKLACKAIDVSRASAYVWRREVPEFRAAWDAAREMAAEALEDEAYRRATGYEEPVYNAKGELAGSITKYSDTLLIFMLKGAKPEKYRERVEMSGSVDIGSAILAARGRTATETGGGDPA